MADLLAMGWFQSMGPKNGAAGSSNRRFLERHAPAKRLGSAVGQEILGDVVAVGLEQDLGAAQLADLLLGPFDHAVAFAGLLKHDLPGRRYLEALFSARLGLQLGHLALLFRPDECGPKRPGPPVIAWIKCAG